MQSSRTRQRGKSVKWNATYELFMKEFLNSKSVKLKSGVEVGHKAVEYFRGQDFAKWVLKHQARLLEKFPECFEVRQAADKHLTDEDVLTLGDRLIQYQFIYKVENANLPSQPSKTEQPLQKQETKPEKFKWPTRVAYCSSNQSFDTHSLFVIAYEHATSWNYVILICIIFFVIAICMFPAWPLQLKLCMWYLLVVFTTVLIVLIILRLIFFVLLWFAGFDFWFLPNFFDEQLGFIDSFIPAYSILYRKDSWTMVMVRIALALLTAGMVYQLGKEHTLEDIGFFAKQQFLDVVDWGHQKLAAPPTDESAYGIHHAKISNVSSESDPERLYDCMIHCGFDSFKVIEEECLFDCTCMTALLDSHCFKRCPEAAKTNLKQAADQVCESTDT